MSGSDFKTGIIILLALGLWSTVMFFYNNSMCYSNLSSYSLNSTDNQTTSHSGIEQIVNLIAPISCDAIPIPVILLTDILWLAVLWYFLRPKIAGSTLGGS